MAKKILAQAQFDKTSGLQELKEVLNSAVISSMDFTNLYEDAAFVNVYVVPNGETLASKHTIFNKLKIDELETFVAMQGITMSTGDKVFVEAGTRPESLTKLTDSVSVSVAISKVSSSQLGVLFVDSNYAIKTKLIDLNTMSVSSERTISKVSGTSASITMQPNTEYFAYGASDNTIMLESIKMQFALDEGAAVMTRAGDTVNYPSLITMDQPMIAQLTKTKFVMAFRNQSSGNDIYTVVGDIQPNGMATWGPIQNVLANDMNITSFQIRRVDSSTFVMLYTPSDNTGLINIHAASVTGNIVGFAAPINVSFGGSITNGRFMRLKDNFWGEFWNDSILNGPATNGYYYIKYRGHTLAGTNFTQVVAGGNLGGGTYYPNHCTATEIEWNGGLHGEGIGAYYYGYTPNGSWSIPGYLYFNRVVVDSLNAMSWKGDVNYSTGYYDNGYLGSGKLGSGAAVFAFKTNNPAKTRLITFRRWEENGNNAGWDQDYGDLDVLLTWPKFVKINNEFTILTDQYSNTMYMIFANPTTSLIDKVVKISGLSANYYNPGGPLTVDPDGENAIISDTAAAGARIRLYPYLLLAKTAKSGASINAVSMCLQDTGKLYSVMVYADSTNSKVSLRSYSNRKNDWQTAEIDVVTGISSNDVRVKRVDDTHLLITYRNSAANNITGIVATFDGTTGYTFGTPAVLQGTATDWGIDELTTNSFAFAALKTDGTIDAKTLSISGTAITQGTAGTVMSNCKDTCDLIANSASIVSITSKRVDNIVTQKFDISGGVFSVKSSTQYQTTSQNKVSISSFDAKTITASAGNSVDISKDELAIATKVNVNIFGDEL
jgi:hypothetical protein